MDSDFPYAAERYRGFRDDVFEALTGSLVREGGNRREAAKSVSEMEIQARWFGGEFGRRFETTDGKGVEVVQFGHWNHSAGPDFTEAAVKFDDSEVRQGALEIDLDVESWESHGHGSNREFNQVVLHVFLNGPAEGERRFYTRTENHCEVPQVMLDLSRLVDSKPAPLDLPEARPGRCSTPLREMAEENLVSLLNAAAQYRLRQKSHRLGKIGKAHGQDQMLYQVIAEALGFRHNKVTMAILAQRLPLSTLRNRPSIERESLLFGASGFIGHDQFEAAEDDDSRIYLKGLWDHWWKLRTEFEPGPERGLEWKLAGTRPVNHPQRRLAGLASLLNSWPTFMKLAMDFSSPDWEKQLGKLFGGLKHEFWNHHYTLKSKPSARPMTLIGKDRVRDILGNILYPLAVADSPSTNWPRYTRIPAVDSNESLRRAVLRLFGEDVARGKEFSKRYFQQQALLQIYRDFCLEDVSECADCPFPEQLSQWA